MRSGERKMFCGVCGKELPEGTRYCSECGSPVAPIEEGSPFPEPEPADEAEAFEDDTLESDDDEVCSPIADATASFIPAYKANSAKYFAGTSNSPATESSLQPAVAQAKPAGAASGDSKQAKRLIIAVIVIVAIIGASIGGLIWKSAADKQAAFEHDHADRTIMFTLHAPGYDAATASPIPLHIEGRDLDGNGVDQVFYATPSDATIALKKGDYTVDVAASPILADGTLYQVPAETIDLIVGEGDLRGGDLSWTFVTIEPADATDDQIETAYQYAVSSGMDVGTAEALKAAAVQARKTAQDQKAAAEAAAAQKKAADEAAAQAAARHYSDGYVSLDVPSSWVGTYAASSTGRTSGAWHTDFMLNGTSITLMCFDGVVGSGACTMGYSNTASLLWQVAHGRATSSTATLEQLAQALNLQTGGSISSNQVVAFSTQAEAEAAGASAIETYLTKTIAPTVVAS